MERFCGMVVEWRLGNMDGSESVVVRAGNANDVVHIEAIQQIMIELARSYDLAIRDISWLLDKLDHGSAVLAIDADTNTAIGFGCFSVWRDADKVWISHSAILVDPHCQARKIGTRIGEELIRLSQEKFPDGTILVLTTNPRVKTIYAKAGGVEVPLVELTQNCEFWEGCRGCRSFVHVNNDKNVGEDRNTPAGFKCCCDGMIIQSMSKH